MNLHVHSPLEHSHSHYFIKRVLTILNFIVKKTLKTLIPLFEIMRQMLKLKTKKNTNYLQLRILCWF
jgi:hypothetical protein